MRLMAAKMREMAASRSAFDKAQIQMMLDLKRKEDELREREEARVAEEERVRVEEALALREGKLREKEHAEALLAGAGVDLSKQELLLGEALRLSSKEYACVRLLQVFGMVEKPVSDAVKKAMRQFNWPGQSWKRKPERIWLAVCRETAGEKDRPAALKEDATWSLPITTKIMRANVDAILDVAAHEIRDAERHSGQFQRSLTHITELHRCWQWLVQGNTVETEIMHGILGIAHLLHVLGCPAGSNR
jgi:hypothetical protein